MLQGKVIKDTFIVVDTFALPVEGTETRVNAAEGAYEYLTTYPETAKVGSGRMVHQLSGFAFLNSHFSEPVQKQDVSSCTAGSGTTRKHRGGVPFTSRVWLLAIRH